MGRNCVFLGERRISAEGSGVLTRTAGHLRPRSSRRPRPGRHRAGYMSGRSRLVTGGDWRTRQANSTLGSGETPGPHAPIGRSRGPSAATPLTQLPFGSPAASRSVTPAEIGHGSPMCAFELGRDSSPARHTAGVGSPMLFSPAAQTATTPQERQCGESLCRRGVTNDEL